MPREILVVKRDDLFADRKLEGFCSIDEYNFLEKILSNFEYVERNDELESNPFYQQIIPYIWLVNPSTKQVFIYKRSKDGGEGRLHEKYSGGVGGHIDKDTEEREENPLLAAAIRELKEETVIERYPSPNFTGFINDDSDAVNSVHFGVVAIAETTLDVKPAEHMADGKFYSLEQVEELFSNPETDVEKWTRISWPFVRNYLTSLPN